MAEHEVPSTRRKTGMLASGLWIASGVIVLVGCILRPLGTYFGRELRYTGIAVIAIGALLAVIAWADERWGRGKTRD